MVSTLLYLQGNQLARKEKEYCSERCASLTTRWRTRANVNPPKRALRPVPPTKVTPEITKTNDHPEWAIPMARGFYIQNRGYHMEYFYLIKATQKSGKADAVIWRTNKSEARAPFCNWTSIWKTLGSKQAAAKTIKNQFAPISRYSMTCRRKVFSITHGANATSSATTVAPGL